jgi:hypothetical protein
MCARRGASWLLPAKARVLSKCKWYLFPFLPRISCSCLLGSDYALYIWVGYSTMVSFVSLQVFTPQDTHCTGGHKNIQNQGDLSSGHCLLFQAFHKYSIMAEDPRKHLESCICVILFDSQITHVMIY